MHTTFGRLIGKLALAAGLALSVAGVSLATPDPVYVRQGNAWTAAARADFYSRDQGSRIIPLAWLRALKAADGQPFLHDGLARYGYLPNPNGRFNLPVGFMAAAGPAGVQYAAMNCSACHTRQIAVGGSEYRIDGGPAISDFQAFLSDLDAAVGRVLADDTAFAAFAAAVPGAGPDLRDQVAAWYRREHVLISRALPTGNPWGLGRLDAVSMIFNRLTAMDLGPPPSYMIDGNVQPAIAPVRYPFLWNAPRQDRTQWPGFAQNGNDLLALTRNLGQVYGVFGIYRPRRQGNHVDFLTDNSTQWAGLDRLETLVKSIGRPIWPWPRTRDQQRLADRGREIFERPNWQDGGCISCHGIRPGSYRVSLSWPFLNPTWATPLCDTGTDTAQYSILGRTAQTGVLRGARLPFGQPVGGQAKAFDLLAISVIGSIVQNKIFVSPYFYENSAATLAPVAQQVVGIFAPPSSGLCGAQAGPHQYESRVLQGIWATAPYLHNGSVPTLMDLLTRPEDRPASFALGRNYDTELVGLARDQGASAPERRTTGCGDLASGNSRCGHDFGTNLSASDKLALLEYLKTL